MISALERSDYEILIDYEIGGTPSGVLPTLFFLWAFWERS